MQPHGGVTNDAVAQARPRLRLTRNEASCIADVDKAFFPPTMRARVEGFFMGDDEFAHGVLLGEMVDAFGDHGEEVYAAKRDVDAPALLERLSRCAPEDATRVYHAVAEFLRLRRSGASLDDAAVAAGFPLG